MDLYFSDKRSVNTKNKKKSSFFKIKILRIIAITLMITTIVFSTNIIKKVDSDEVVMENLSNNKIDSSLYFRLVSTEGIGNKSSSTSMIIFFTHELTDKEIEKYEEIYNLKFINRYDGKILHVENMYCLYTDNDFSMDDLISLTRDPVVKHISDGEEKLSPFLDTSIQVIGADNAWEETPMITGQDITVCIIDSGIDWQHPDFRYLNTDIQYNWFDTNSNNLFEPPLD